MSDMIVGVRRLEENYGKKMCMDEVVEVPFFYSKWYGNAFVPVHGRNYGNKKWVEYTHEKNPEVHNVRMTVRSLKEAYDVDIVFWLTSEGEWKAFATWWTEEEPNGHFIVANDNWLDG